MCIFLNSNIGLLDLILDKWNKICNAYVVLLKIKTRDRDFVEFVVELPLLSVIATF